MSRVPPADQLAGAFIALLALAATFAVFVPRCLGAASGAETEIVSALKEVEDEGLVLPIEGAAGPLRSYKLMYARITVSRSPEGTRAEALATLDFEGTLPPEARVSGISLERVPFVFEDREWQAPSTAAPRLQGVVRALEARRQALEQGDVARLAALDPGGRDPASDPGLARLLALKSRRYRVDAWFIRIEEDVAVVKERYRLQGDLPDRPVDERGEAQLSLVREGAQFFFAAGGR